MKPGDLVEITPHSFWYKTDDLIKWAEHHTPPCPVALCVEGRSPGLLLRYIGKGRSAIQSSEHYWEVLVEENIYDVAEKNIVPLSQP